MENKYEAQKRSIAEFIQWSKENGIEIQNIDILRHSVAFEEGWNACKRNFKDHLEEVTIFKYKDLLP